MQPPFWSRPPHLIVSLDDLEAEVVLLVEPQVGVRHDVQRVDHAARRLGRKEGHLLLRPAARAATFRKSGSLQGQELIFLQFRLRNLAFSETQTLRI